MKSGRDREIDGQSTGLPGQARIRARGPRVPQFEAIHISKERTA
jgi:hypothetical protein